MTTTAEHAEPLFACCQAMERNGVPPEQVLDALQKLATTYHARVFDAAAERQQARIRAARMADQDWPVPEARPPAPSAPAAKRKPFHRFGSRS